VINLRYSSQSRSRCGCDLIKFERNKKSRIAATVVEQKDFCLPRSCGELFPSHSEYRRNRSCGYATLLRNCHRATSIILCGEIARSRDVITTTYAFQLTNSASDQDGLLLNNRSKEGMMGRTELPYFVAAALSVGTIPTQYRTKDGSSISD
jgi:hypothetical protein